VDHVSNQLTLFD